MTAGQRSKQEWVAGLAELEPDLVIDTGDNLAGHDAVPGDAARAGPAARPPGRLRDGQQRLLRAAAQEPAQVLPARTTSGCTATRCPGATCATA